MERDCHSSFGIFNVNQPGMTSSLMMYMKTCPLKCLDNLFRFK